MQEVEQTLNSREVAEMIEKDHSKLLRDLRRYEEQFAEANIGLGDFFKQSVYIDANNQNRPCYRITKKGCEFIAHKLTGTKGTIFTARYINRFHKMEEMIKRLPVDQKLPWFVRKFRGKYVILQRDFIEITGVDITKDRRFYSESYFTPGVDWNGFGEKDKFDTDEFKQEYGFEYGDDSVLIYLFPCGVLKAISLLADGKHGLNPDAYKIFRSGFQMLRKTKKTELGMQGLQKERVIRQQISDLPIQINIIYGSERV